jgi:hypothetical protein
MKHPDAELHLKFSIVKSIFRVLAGLSLMCNMTVVCGLLFIVAEILGIVEELV